MEFAKHLITELVDVLVCGETFAVLKNVTDKAIAFSDKHSPPPRAANGMSLEPFETCVFGSHTDQNKPSYSQKFPVPEQLK